MLTFVSKYATAAHLALLTVAPLFLFPFCSEGEIAKVLLWLSVLGTVWIVMSPSVKGDERPHNARLRFISEVLADPLFWFSLFLVIISAIRALNGGVAFAYDAENYTWALSLPKAEILPGCVDGAGFLPFSMSIVLLIVLQGFRHALDRNAVIGYLVSASVLSGLSAIVIVATMSYGNKAVLSLADCSYLVPTFVGTAYGIHFIGGIAALFCCIEAKMVAAELLTAVSMSATALGLAIFSPPITLVVFVVAFVVVVILSFALGGRALAGAGSLRCMLAILISVFAAVSPFLLCDPSSALSARCDDILAYTVLPAGFAESYRALSDIALRVWKTNPWLGTGLGSFMLDIKFLATPADWSVISPLQTASICGWWQLLAERGIIGALMFAITGGFLVWSYVRRLLLSFSRDRFRSVHCLGPLILLVLVALAFVDCSFLRVDVLLAAAAAMALSTAALPEDRRAGSNAKEVK